MVRSVDKRSTRCQRPFGVYGTSRTAWPAARLGDRAGGCIRRRVGREANGELIKESHGKRQGRASTRHLDLLIHGGKGDAVGHPDYKRSSRERQIVRMVGDTSITFLR